MYEDALSLVTTGHVITRESTRPTVHGKNSQQVTDTWKVVGISGLTSAGFYGELGSGIRKFRMKIRAENTDSSETANV